MTAVEPRPVTKRRKTVYVTLNTRVSLDVRELIDDLAEREDLTIREIVESAVLEKWGRGVE